MVRQELNPDVEAVLSEYYSAASPEESFVRALEGRILKEHPARSHVVRPYAFIRQLRAAFLVVLLVLGLTFMIYGPERVWAAIQQVWRRYIPGIGVVETMEALVLEEPAVHTENGVTLTVEELVAAESGTFMRVRLSGLSEDTQVHPVTIAIELQDGHRLDVIAAQSQLVMEPSQETGFESGPKMPERVLSFEFEPMPSGEREVRVVWNITGLVPGSSVTDSWVLEVSLAYLAQEVDGRERLISYAIESTDERLDGIRVSVLEVHQLPDMTMIVLEYAAPEQYFGLSAVGAYLVDNEGREYPAISHGVDIDEIGGTRTQLNGDTERISVQRLSFEPLLSGVTALELHVPSLHAHTQSDASFDIVLPENPEAGDTVAINERIEVAGMPVEFRSANFVLGDVTERQGDTTRIVAEQLLVAFDVTIPLTSQGRRLYALWLTPGWAESFWRSADSVFDPDSGAYINRIIFDPERIWRQKAKINISNAQVVLDGDWILKWDIPE